MKLVNLVANKKGVFVVTAKKQQKLFNLGCYSVTEITAFVFSPEIFNRSQHWYLTRPVYFYHTGHQFEFRFLCFECSYPIKEPF